MPKIQGFALSVRSRRSRDGDTRGRLCARPPWRGGFEGSVTVAVLGRTGLGPFISPLFLPRPSWTFTITRTLVFSRSQTVSLLALHLYRAHFSVSFSRPFHRLIAAAQNCAVQHGMCSFSYRDPVHDHFVYEHFYFDARECADHFRIRSCVRGRDMFVFA